MRDSDPIRRASLPSWLISVLLHMALILVLGLTLRMGPPQGAAAERTAEVGIVLKRQDGDKQHFQGSRCTDIPCGIGELTGDSLPNNGGDPLRHIPIGRNSPSAFPKREYDIVDFFSMELYYAA